MYSTKAVLFSVLFFIYQGFSNNEWKSYDICIFVLTIYTFINFLDKLGNKVTILEFIGFSAVMLWLTMPALLITSGLSRYLIGGFEVLAVSENIYYSYALPGTIALSLGLLITPMQGEHPEKRIFELVSLQLQDKKHKNTVKTLVITGVIGTILYPISPPELKFFSYLVSQVLYVSIFYAFFSPYTNKYIIGSILLTIMIAEVISSGMFGVLVWWGLCGVMIFSIRYKFSFFGKLSIAVMGVLFILFLQVIKKEYRDLTWYAAQKTEDNSTIFLNLLKKTLSNPDVIFSDKSLSRTLSRANQASLSSLVLKHVPSKEPYAEGETIINSVLSSLVPRFLWENKVKSGGLENMKRFAGVDFTGTNTSMDIGQIGDGYANFGKMGGIIFLFFYGVFNNLLYHKIVSLSLSKYPTLILWSPFIFIQLLKVEVSVETMFNAATKGAFFVFLCYWGFKKLFKIQL